MPDTNLTDTDKKIVMKDHDILIQLTTQMSELLRRYDDNIRVEQERNQNFAVEMKGVSLEQVRVSTELKSLRKDLNEHKQAQTAWQTRWEQKSNVWDVLNSLGILISAAIGYLLGK